MKRVSVDIGGTFTDCFVAWGEQCVEGKALTTHHNLAVGFNDALADACRQLALTPQQLLPEVDSVRYATTLGTNALIERKGPRVGLLVTTGFKHTVPLSRARGYGEGLSEPEQMDIPNAARPDAPVPIPMIREVRERVDSRRRFWALDEDDVRLRIRELVDAGAQALVVMFTNSVVNPAHELRVREIFLEEYPAHMLGAVPVLLSHQVVGRKGEYARYLHHRRRLPAPDHVSRPGHARTQPAPAGLPLADAGQPQFGRHGPAQLHRCAADGALGAGFRHRRQRVPAAAAELGNVVATDMGGTSFDIGIVVQGGLKFYDFNPVIDRWLVSVPMVPRWRWAPAAVPSRATSACTRPWRSPQSAGSDPGPACYDRGGQHPTVTDADLLLGYLDPKHYANGRIPLNVRRARWSCATPCAMSSAST